MSKSWNQGSHTFLKTILYFFNTKWKNFIAIAHLHFFNFIHGAQCKKYLRNCHRRKMQNSNRRMAQFEISTLFRYCMFLFGQIQSFFKVLESRFWKPILFHTFKTAWGTLWNNKTLFEEHHTYMELARGRRGYKSLALNHLGATNHCRERKSPNNITSTFFSAAHLLPKDIRFEHGRAKLVSYPGAI